MREGPRMKASWWEWWSCGNGTGHRMVQVTASLHLNLRLGTPDMQLTRLGAPNCTMWSKISYSDCETNEPKSGLPWKIQRGLWCSGRGCAVGSNFFWELQFTAGGWGPGRRRLLQKTKGRPLEKYPPPSSRPQLLLGSSRVWGGARGLLNTKGGRSCRHRKRRLFLPFCR